MLPGVQYQPPGSVEQIYLGKERCGPSILDLEGSISLPGVQASLGNSYVFINPLISERRPGSKSNITPGSYNVLGS